jgi:intracellular septation protein
MPDTPSKAPPENPNPLAKLAIEAGPLLVFFIANMKFGIFAATGAFMAAITISLLASWFLERRLPPMALFTAAFVLVLGGLTIYLEDELFIKLKPTIVNTLFAGILTVGLLTGRLLLKIVFGAAFQLTDEGWRILTRRWIVFFLILAILNEVVWRSTSTDTWVSFKVFGIMPLTIVFGITLLPLLKRHELPEEEEERAAG